MFRHKAISLFLRATGLQYWPVRVRSGVAAGARWTLFPWSSYWRGTQEPTMHRALLALGDITGWSCWDLGAHFGIYSVGLVRRVGPTGAVAAFEPNPFSHARLVRHRDMNRLSWLQVFQAGVSDQTSTGLLFTYGQLDSTTTHLPYEGEPLNAAAQPVQIQTVALDDFVREGRIRPPDLIKIDVEGHGHRALAGAIETIRTKRPVILMGFHCAPEFDGAHALLDPLGYRWEPIEGPESSGDLRDFLLVPPGR